MHHIKELSLEERRAIGTVLQLSDHMFGWGELCGSAITEDPENFDWYGSHVWVLVEGKQYVIPFTAPDRMDAPTHVWYDGTPVSPHPYWHESLVEFLMR